MDIRRQRKLQTRLRLTRWADDFANEAWQYGTNTAYLKELAAYWIEGYDWRKEERAINAYPQFRTEIDGVPIHFIHGVASGRIPRRLSSRTAGPGPSGNTAK